MANPVRCREPGDTGCFFRKPLLKKGMFENEKFSIKQIFDLQTYSLAYNPIFEAFDTSKIDEYAAQAKAYWGKTPAYKEFEEKSRGRTKEEDKKIYQGMIDIFGEFGQIRNTEPSSKDAQALVKKLQDYITEHMYTCTKKILSSLGKMYAGGGDFTKNIDSYGGEGTAEFTSQAIEIYCR